MKKTIITSTIFLAGSTFLQDAYASQLGTITPPPATNVTIVETVMNLVGVAMSFGILAFLAMFIFGSLEWLTSNGEKAGVEKAKARMTSAGIGVVLLGLSWTIFSIVRSITYTGAP